MKQTLQLQQGDGVEGRRWESGGLGWGAKTGIVSMSTTLWGLDISITSLWWAPTPENQNPLKPPQRSPDFKSAWARVLGARVDPAAFMGSACGRVSDTLLLCPGGRARCAVVEAVKLDNMWPPETHCAFTSLIHTQSMCPTAHAASPACTPAHQQQQQQQCWCDLVRRQAEGGGTKAWFFSANVSPHRFNRFIHTIRSLLCGARRFFFCLFVFYPAGLSRLQDVSPRGSWRGCSVSCFSSCSFN